MKRYPELTSTEIVLLNASKCADCEGPIYEGSSGSGSVNYICGNERCGSKFNMSLSWERISAPWPMRTDEDSMPIALPIDTKEPSR